MTGRHAFLIAALPLALAACGGGGASGGGSIASTPGPTPAPTPAPAAPTGAWNDTSASRSFVTLSADVTRRRDMSTTTVTTGLSGQSEADDVAIRDSKPDEAYFITLRGDAEGRLVSDSNNSQLNRIDTGGSLAAAPTVVFNSIGGSTYGSVVEWRKSTVANGVMTLTDGLFAFGTATPAGAIPASGTASYRGNVRGFTDFAVVRTGENSITSGDVSGTVAMQVNFGSSTLSGIMDLGFSCNNCFESPIGPIAFAGQLGAGGSYNGQFFTSLPGANWLSGQLIGPGANETIAAFQVPFSEFWSGDTRVVSGVWIAKQ
jgi:hypothetical protein